MVDMLLYCANVHVYDVHDKHRTASVLTGIPSSVCARSNIVSMVDREALMATVHQKVAAAFKELRAKGYFAEQDHTCCNTCGWYEIPDEMKKKVVFYHQQETESFKKTGKCYLNWAGDAKEITDVFVAHGLHVNWNGSPTMKMIVSGRPTF